MRYEVHMSGMYQGRYETFWFKKNALKFAESMKSSYPWIEIIDLISRKRIEIQVPKTWPIEIYDDNGLPTGEFFGEYTY